MIRFPVGYNVGVGIQVLPQFIFVCVCAARARVCVCVCVCNWDREAKVKYSLPVIWCANVLVILMRVVTGVLVVHVYWFGCRA